MIKVVDFIITPEQAKDTDFLQKLIQRELKINDNSFDFRWLKRSIDARKKQIKINARFEVAIGEEFPKREIFFSRSRRCNIARNSHYWCRSSRTLPRCERYSWV